MPGQPMQRDRDAEPGSAATEAGPIRCFLIDVKLRDGRSHSRQLPAGMWPRFV